MPSSQHDGASDEGEKRNGNGSQDRWHQRAGSGARGRRGSGSLLRHDCAAHCSHHHNGDKGGAPHCCQSRSHCAADDEGSTQTTRKGEPVCSALLSCKAVCSADVALQGELALLDRLVTVARTRRRRRKIEKLGASGGVAKMHEGEDSCSERQWRYTTPSLYTPGSSETFLRPARSDPPRLRVLPLSLSARPPALRVNYISSLSLVPTAPFRLLPPERP